MMSKQDCWAICLNMDVCKLQAAEKQVEFVCLGPFCTKFKSQCFVCDQFTKGCDTCPDLFDPKKSPQYLRHEMAAKLKPSNSYGTITQYGVHSIKTDGSLLGDRGVEIITCGRRPDYWEYYKMFEKIIKTALENRAYVNERCSIHAHLLAAYYGNSNELERPIPEIILANFHQLCRRYQNAITWMTMGLDSEEYLTRWEKYRVSIIDISPRDCYMNKVAERVFQNANDTKYSWVNYAPNVFTNTDQNAATNQTKEQGATSRLHLELRVMDALLSPSAVAAIGCLYVALFIKAVEISRYGLLNVDDEKLLTNLQKIKEVLLNNRKNFNDGDRFSNTSKLKPYFDVLIFDSLELIDQLKHILAKFGPCYSVLEKLATEPCAIKRTKGKSWEKIEEELSVVCEEDSILGLKLGQIIDTKQIDKCLNEEEWIAEAAKILFEDAELMEIFLGYTLDDIKKEIQSYIGEKEKTGETLWMPNIGAFSFV